MPTVAGQSVGPDSISGAVKGGTRSNVGNTAGFLGSGQPPDGSSCGAVAGAAGCATGPGANTLPMSGSASPMNSVQKPFRKGGI